MAPSSTRSGRQYNQESGREDINQPTRASTGGAGRVGGSSGGESSRSVISAPPEFNVPHLVPLHESKHAPKVPQHVENVPQRNVPQENVPQNTVIEPQVPQELTISSFCRTQHIPEGIYRDPSRSQEGLPQCKGVQRVRNFAESVASSNSMLQRGEKNDRVASHSRSSESVEPLQREDSSESAHSSLETQRANKREEKSPTKEPKQYSKDSGETRHKKEAICVGSMAYS